MRRIFAYPLLWIALFCMWALLSRSVAPGSLLVGAIVASICCWALGAIAVPRPRIRKLGSIARLIGLVLADVFRSNIAVVRLTLGRRKPRSSFVTIPLALRDPNGLAVLACIITATPGSAWISHSLITHSVLLHVLDVDDAEAWGATVKRTYEALLMEIFQ